MIPLGCKRVSWISRAARAACLVCVAAAGSAALATVHAQTPASPSEPAKIEAMAPGVPFTPAQLTGLLPATVYFAGRTAPLQLRNAGGTKFANGTILWVALVDSAGYSTAVQDRYQFYLVVEAPVRFGDAELRVGAYGGGFVGNRFLLMDLGDHTVAEGATQTDAALRRPRPLQLTADRPDAVKLFLGRKWVSIQTTSP